MKHMAVGERKVGDEVQPTRQCCAPANRPPGRCHAAPNAIAPDRTMRLGLADLGAKHAFLRAGLGWGSMPLSMVEEDIARGALGRIELEAQSGQPFQCMRSTARIRRRVPRDAGLSAS